MFKLYYIAAKATFEALCFRLCYFSAGWDEKSQNVLQMPVLFLIHLCLLSAFSADSTHLKDPILLLMIAEKGSWGFLKNTETST